MSEVFVDLTVNQVVVQQTLMVVEPGAQQDTVTVQPQVQPVEVAVRSETVRVVEVALGGGAAGPTNNYFPSGWS